MKKSEVSIQDKIDNAPSITKEQFQRDLDRKCIEEERRINEQRRAEEALRNGEQK